MTCRFIEYIQEHPRHFIIPAIGILITLYFTYHAIRGERGLFRLFEINQEINEAQSILKQTEEEKNEMDKKVKALSPGSLDLDMLDESGRRILNVGEKNDYIIFD